MQSTNKSGSNGQAWKFTSDGYILSGLKTADGDQLYLTIARCNHMEGGRLCLWPKADSLGQRWSTNNAGHIISALNQCLITIDNNADSAMIGKAFRMAPLDLNNKDQMWSFDKTALSTIVTDVDIVTANTSFFKLYCNAVENQFLEVVNSDDANGIASPGATVQTYWDRPNDVRQLWKLTADGFLQSALKTSNGESLVVEILNGPTASVRLAVKSTSIVAQRWRMNNYGSLISIHNGLALTYPQYPEMPIAVLPQTNTSDQMWTKAAQDPPTSKLISLSEFAFV